MATLNIKAVMAAIESMLKGHGFEKAQTNVFTKVLSDGIISWVGLNKATRSGNLEINLVVGLRFKDVEKIVHDLLNEKDDGITPPTVAGNVGYVGDYEKYYAIIFSSDDDILQGVKELDIALKKWGVTFFDENKNLVALSNLLSTARYLMPEQVAYRLPVVLNLIGRNKEASDFIESKIKAESVRVDPAAERYRKFGNSFLAKYGA